MTMDPNMRLTTTTHGYPLSSYCVGLPNASRPDPEGNVHSVASDCHNDGRPVPLDDLFADLRIDDVLAYSMKDMHASLVSTQPNIFDKLPPELVYRILGFMYPEDYTGFACACQLALELSNNQVTLEWPEFLTTRLFYISYPPLPKELCSIKEQPPSLKNYIAAARLFGEFFEEHSSNCMGGFVGSDEDDEDLI